MAAHASSRPPLLAFLLGLLVGAALAGAALLILVVPPPAPVPPPVPPPVPSSPPLSPPAGPGPAGDAAPSPAEPGGELERLRAEVERLRAELAARDAAVEPGEEGGALGLDLAELVGKMSSVGDDREGRARFSALLRELAERARAEPQAVVDFLLERLATDPGPALVRIAGSLVTHQAMRDEPVRSVVGPLADRIATIALSPGDPETRKTALSRLVNLVNGGLVLDETQLAALGGLAAGAETAGLRRAAMATLSRVAPDRQSTRSALYRSLRQDPDPESRQAALDLLRESEGQEEAFRTVLHDLVRTDASSSMRVAALKSLARMRDPETKVLQREILTRETDPELLYEAADIQNMGNPTGGNLQSYKQTAREFLRRQVDDRARARAAANLSMLSILTADDTVAADIRQLGNTLSDAELADTARRVADLLEGGDPGFEELQKLWRAVDIR